MHCKSCGEKIALDSIFCKKCGARQFSENKNPQSAIESVEIKNGSSKGKKVGIFLILLLGVSLLFACCWNREATNNDIKIDAEINIANLGVELEMESLKNIRDLEIELLHYNKQGNLIKSQIIELGDVKKGQHINKTISVTQFSLSDLWEIKWTKVVVSAGSVWLF